MDNKIAKWAEDTIQVYLDIIEKEGYDVAFYQQSPLNTKSLNPEVVVLGINPGSGGTYSDQKVNEVWGMGGKDATAQHLLNGNVCWNDVIKGHNTWVYVRNVKELLQPTFSDIIDDGKSIIFTNATFFATSKANELNGGILKETLPCTIDLINLLQPNIVIGLSGKALFKQIQQYEHDFVYEKVFDAKLLIGKLCGITYIGIYHPASWYSHPLKALVGKVIRLVNNNRAQSLKEIVSIVKDNCGQEWANVCNYKPSANHRYEEAQTMMKMIVDHFKNASITKDTVTIPVNDLVKIVFVAQKSQQYIYCRHTDFNGKRPYVSSETKYKYCKEISDILSRYNYTQETYALGKKPLSEFAITDNSEENAQLIINEINGIIKEINLII